VHYLKKDGTYKTLELFEKSSIVNEDLTEEISDEEKNTKKDDNTKPNKNIKRNFFEYQLPSFFSRINAEAKEKNAACQQDQNRFNKFKNVLKIMRRDLSIKEDQRKESKEIESLKDKILKLNNENEDLKKIIYEQNKELRTMRNYIHEKNGNIRVFCRLRPTIPTEQKKA